MTIHSCNERIEATVSLNRCALSALLNKCTRYPNKRHFALTDFVRVVPFELEALLAHL
jgi:hypothetical protein